MSGGSEVRGQSSGKSFPFCETFLKISLLLQVTSLIGAHTDTFTAILKSHRGSVSMATLEELSLVTGVIGHSGVGQDWSDQDSTAVGSGMMYIQRLMMSLIPNYCDRRVSGGEMLSLCIPTMTHFFSRGGARGAICPPESGLPPPPPPPIIGECSKHS